MPNDLDDLDERECRERDEDRLEPVEERERLRLEHRVQERRIDDRDLEGHRREDGEDQLRVREQADLPNRLTGGSHREDQEELEEDNRRECDGPGWSRVGAFSPCEAEDTKGSH